ncbi:MAG: Uma2 family endonuclease [Acidobacteriota bacterium]|nr:Uma2 family endonuclease [Acidobacteriota bacterium]
MASQPAHVYPLDEYLQQERRADSRSEYFEGEVFAVSGGTGRHSELSARMIMLLGRGPCRVFDSNLKIYLQESEQCVYSDASVVCEAPKYLDQREDVLLNPALVVEVLSPSTERYDKGSKGLYYRNLPSLRHCLLISQDRVFIEHSERQENRTWVVQTYTDLNGKISLKLLGLELSIDEIYRGVLPGQQWS